MGIRTPLSPEEICTLFSSHFGIDDIASSRPAERGRANTNYIANTASGAHYVLTVVEPDSHGGITAENVPWFTRLLQEIAANLGEQPKFRIPVPLGQPALREGKHLCAFSFLEGGHLKELTPKQSKQYGEALASFHKLATDAAQKIGPRATPGTDRSEMDTLAQLLDNVVTPNLQKEKQILAKELKALKKEWPRATRGCRSGLISRDAGLENLLMADGLPPALLDIWGATEGMFALDRGLAMRAFTDTETGSFNLENARAFLTGYNNIMPLSMHEVEASLFFLKFAYLRGAIHTLSRYGEPLMPGADVKQTPLDIVMHNVEVTGNINDRSVCDSIAPTLDRLPEDAGRIAVQETRITELPLDSAESLAHLEQSQLPINLFPTTAQGLPALKEELEQRWPDLGFKAHIVHHTMAVKNGHTLEAHPFSFSTSFEHKGKRYYGPIIISAGGIVTSLDVPFAYKAAAIVPEMKGFLEQAAESSEYGGAVMIYPRYTRSDVAASPTYQILTRFTGATGHVIHDGTARSPDPQLSGDLLFDYLDGDDKTLLSDPEFMEKITAIRKGWSTMIDKVHARLIEEGTFAPANQWRAERANALYVGELPGKILLQELGVAAEMRR